MTSNAVDANLPFPAGFLWGTATSAHQVEGNNRNNDWWAFEQQPGAIWHGDRIGQIIFEKIAEEELVEVTDFGEEETERGAGGFGSTGK